MDELYQNAGMMPGVDGDGEGSAFSGSEGEETGEAREYVSRWEVLGVEGEGGGGAEREAENRELARAMRRASGKERLRLRDRLIVQNIPLVIHWAQRFEGRQTAGLGFDDMCSEGTLGLMKAVEKFDPDGGRPFGSVAGCWIRQAIRRSLVKKAQLIALPERVEHEIWHFRQAEDAVVSELGRTAATDAAVAARMGEDARRRGDRGGGTVTAERVAELRRLSERAVSLDMPVGAVDDEGNQMVLGDMIPADMMMPREEADRKYLVEQMMEHVEALPERERQIVRAWAGFEDGQGAEGRREGRVTLDDLAARLKISRERVRQLRDRALRTLAEKLWEGEE